MASKKGCGEIKTVAEFHSGRINFRDLKILLQIIQHLEGQRGGLAQVLPSRCRVCRDFHILWWVETLTAVSL